MFAFWCVLCLPRFHKPASMKRLKEPTASQKQNLEESEDHIDVFGDDEIVCPKFLNR